MGSSKYFLEVCLLGLRLVLRRE